MWYISAVLCLLSMGDLNYDMCLAYSNADLIERNSSLIMKCLPVGSANV